MPSFSTTVPCHVIKLHVSLNGLNIPSAQSKLLYLGYNLITVEIQL